MSKPSYFWLLCVMFSPFSIEAMKYQVSGVNETIERNVLAFINTKSYDCQSVNSPISRQYKDFIQQVHLAIQPFGYFSAKVDVQVNETCEMIGVNIDLGPITVITESNILIKGGDEDFDDLLSKHNLQVGMPLKQELYEKFKNQLLELANEKFYLDALFEQNKIDVYPDLKEASITLVFNTGPRYQIYPVNIELNDPFLSKQLISHLLDIKEDQFISQTDLFEMKQKLNSYGYFDQVLFEINQPNSVTSKVPLTITLKPAVKYDYSIGLGYSTDAGTQSSFKYNNHRVNLRGHQFDSQLSLSQLRSELFASYKIPSVKSLNDKWYNIHMGYRDEQTDYVDSQTTKLGISQTVIQESGWQNIVFIDLLNEQFDTGVEQGESLLLVPGMSWSLTDADNITRSSHGYKIQAEIKGSTEDMFSDASFVQVSVSGKYIHSVGDTNRLLYRTALGVTASSDFNELPTTYRFFAGGDQSIRGFDYQSISPLNESGDLAGGKHMAVASVEFEHQFAPQWAVAGFTDFGDAFSDKFDLKYSVGAGLRWFSPIGPVRIDLGVPINQDSNNFRLHVTIGPDL